MATNQLDDSLYDNQISILYKAGESFQVPVRYIKVRDRKSNESADELLIIKDLVYEPITDILSREKENQDFNLERVYLDIGKTPITRQELAFLYYSLFESVEEREKAFQDIQKFIPNSNIQRIGDLNNKFDVWVGKYNSHLDQDTETIDKIRVIQEELEDIPKDLLKETTELTINRVTLKTFPSFISGRVPKIQDGLDIFNSIQLSYLVPYVYYNQGGPDDTIRERYYKVYRGQTTTDDETVSESNLSMIIPNKETKLTNRGNLIYATIWTGQEDQVRTRPTREGYSQVVYDLDTGAMTFKTKISEKNPEAKEQIIDRVKESFPTLNLGRVIETRISGEFDLMLGEKLVDYVLLHEILNNPTFTAYLYIDERVDPYPEKKRITVHYRSIIGEAALDETEDKKSEEIQTPASVSAVIGERNENNKYYLHVNITRAISRDEAQRFRETLRSLFGIYLQDRGNIEDTYSEYITNQQSPKVTIKKTIKGKVTIKKVTKDNKMVPVKLLKAAAPDVFVAGWARKCQGKHQLIPISENEIAEWQSRGIINPETKMKEPRQILRYPPPPNDKIILVCPNDQKPYPGVKINQLSNSEKYPYIPCCYETNQTDNVKPSSEYNAYYLGGVGKSRSEKRRTNIITGKILSPGGFGEIPVPLENVLVRYSDNGYIFKRYGVVRDHNSFIHCVLDALNQSDYTSIKEEERSGIVEATREALVDNVNLALLKQELYDFNLDDIEKQILTPDLFFDPSLYYRAIEEYFNINIYTFGPGKRPKDDKTESFGKIELPRHKIFHTRNLRKDRPTILIYKHWGAEADALDYPQCELIVNMLSDKKIANKLFTQDMTEIVHNVLLDTELTKTWSYDRETSQLLSYENLYSQVNFSTITRFKPLSQIIDDYGKMRGLVVGDGKKSFTYYFLPSQPENLPIAEEAPVASYNDMISVFKNLTAGLIDSKTGKTYGLWFSTPDIQSYDYSIYVPIVPEKSKIVLKVGPRPPFEQEKELQISERLLDLQRDINFIVQLTKWFFGFSNLSPEEFMKKYGAISQKQVTDTATFYNFSKLERRLPDVNSLDEGFRKLEKIIPTFVNGGRLVFYSRVFYDKILAYLRSYNRENSGSLIRSSYLSNYYMHERDFKQQDSRTVVLIGKNSLDVWIASFKRIGYEGLEVSDKLQKNPDRYEPYLYLDPDTEVTFLVQNVDGGISESLNVAKYWSETLINIGFDTVAYDGNIEDLKFSIYEISPSFQLKSKSANQEGSLKILSYGAEDRYAALLPLN